MADSGVMREITTEAELRDVLGFPAIEQIFFHCMKAFMRSQLWEPQTWASDVFPSHAQLVKSIQPTDETLEELERYYGPSHAKGLYG